MTTKPIFRLMGAKDTFTVCVCVVSLWNKSSLHSLTTAQGLFITVHCGNHIYHTA